MARIRGRVLAFVEEWVEAKKFGKGLSAHDIVPSTLYMSDGRMVPVCVVKVSRGEPSSLAPEAVEFPSTDLGGGFP